MDNKEIEYFITGWEADNDQEKGFINTIKPQDYNKTSKEITNYINSINTKNKHTTPEKVYNTLLTLNSK